MTLWCFQDTRDAYDACQCDERIKNGDALLIGGSQVVGLAGTWPIAVTAASGGLHLPEDGVDVADLMGITREKITFAINLARSRGYSLADWAKEFKP